MMEWIEPDLMTLAAWTDGIHAILFFGSHMIVYVWESDSFAVDLPANWIAMSRVKSLVVVHV